MKAALTVLEESRISPEVPVSISSLENGFLLISGAPRIPTGAPVKVLQDERLWLGEVAESRPDGETVIQVIHSLNNLTELSRLFDRFNGRVPAASLVPDMD